MGARIRTLSAADFARGSGYCYFGSKFDLEDRSHESDRARLVALLADDDEQTAAAWATALQLEGWNVLWAPNGDAALSLARQCRPDLLITDWNMPGMDGPALCRAFREDPVLAGVPIILASSLALPAEAAATHDHFLQKPVVPLALFAAVATLMYRDQSLHHGDGSGSPEK